MKKILSLVFFSPLFLISCSSNPIDTIQNDQSLNNSQTTAIQEEKEQKQAEDISTQKPATPTGENVAATDSVKESPQIIEKAFINIPDIEKLSPSGNGAYYILGTTSNNCSKITIKAENTPAGIYDFYELKDYKYGNTTFKYGVKQDWNNLGIGNNIYTFTAYCDGEQVKEASTILNYVRKQPANNYRVPTYTTHPYTKIVDTYENGHKWAEENDVDNFDDCQYQFGTGDAEDGCNEYVKENYGKYKTFHGYECTEDCSGHEAGYEWAEENDVDDTYDCDGNSQSFNEGCEAYVEENY